MFKIFPKSKFFSRLISFLIFTLVTSSLGFVFFTQPAVPPALAHPQVAEGGTWGVGSPFSPAVYAIAHSGNIAYIGGSFSYVGPYTGHGVSFDASGNLRSDLPFIMGGGMGSGSVDTSVPDGSGGWYIAGGFASVGGVTRHGLAHILSDGSLDSLWNPSPDNAVSAIAVSGSDVYVGGQFTTIGGAARNYLAKLNNTNGDADPTWVPDPDDTVSTIAVSGSDIYVGGNFANIGGQARNYLAKLNNTNGNADLTWIPNPDGGINTIAISGSNIYVGGGFANIGGQAINYLAKLNDTNGDADTWSPNPSGMMGVQIETIAFAADGSMVYVGGSFDTIGGESRNNIAAFSTLFHFVSPTSWDPNADRDVNTIIVSGSTVYVGGRFNNIGGQARNYLAALDNTAGNATSWDPNPISYVESISMSGSNLYVGGQFNYIGGVTRNNLAAIDLLTGRPISWNPGSDDQVWSMVLDGSTLYVGGDFSNIGGQTRNLIAALDTGTGLATSWDPNATGGGVRALAVSGSTIYVGGQFTNIGGASRNNIAAIDASTGLATSWDPNASKAGFPPAKVVALAISGSTVYAGGNFDTIGGETRNNIAALDSATGLATGWDPNATGGSGFPEPIVETIVVSGSTIYAGGTFTTIGGEARSGLAALDATTGNATSWDPGGGKIYSLTISGSNVYVGGYFKHIGGEDRESLAAIDAATGSATSWNPTISLDCTGCMIGGPPPYVGEVRAMALGSPVLAGGVFFSPISGGSVRGFAQFGSDPKMKDTLTRQKISTAANHTVVITLAPDIDWDAGDTLTLTFQSDFNLGALASTDANDFDINTGTEETIIDSGTACGGSDAIKLTSIVGQVITFTACPSYTPPGTNATITIQIGTNATTGGTGDSQIVNPTTPGTYTVDLGGSIGDTNSAAVYIVTDDSAIVTATVDPTFTFSINFPHFVTDGYCPLGILDPGIVSTCIYKLGVGTNASGGAVITIQAISDGTNAELNSDANPADVITDITDDTTVTAGTDGYGISLDGGIGWVEANNPGYNFSVDDTPIPDVPTLILSTPGPVSDADVAAHVTHRASISATTPAGNYTQTVLYIATGTF